MSALAIIVLLAVLFGGVTFGALMRGVLRWVGYGLAVAALVYVMHALFGYRGAFWFFVAFYAVMLPLGAIGFCTIYKQRKGLRAVYAADDLRIAEQYAQDVKKFGIVHARRVRDACLQQSQDSLKEALASSDFRYT